MAFGAAFNGPAFSQRHMGYCDQADSTAATLECVNKHNQDVQQKLGAAFKVLLENQDETTKALLNEAQKNWIIYRDAQCKWESGLPEAVSLKRVYELSCLSEMTERRLKLLEAIHAREEEKQPREFGSQPRWMNALAGDYPDIFWRYGHWQSVDLNCDGEKEQVMTGIAVAHIQDSVTIGEQAISEDSHQQVELVVAVSNNPETGRPKARLFRIPVTGKAGVAPRLCRPAAWLEPATRTVAKEEQVEDTGINAPAFCEQAVRITDRTCMPLIIYWQDKDYVLETQQKSVKGKEGEAL